MSLQELRAGNVLAVRRFEPPRLVGHRGAAASAPENTLAGLRRAAALGAGWVEFDAKLTACGQAVLMHDDTLARTTDGYGRVAETTLADIRRLDAGSWFDPAFAGEPVPTLAEALACAAGLRLGVNVEVKPCRGRAAATARAVIEALVELWPADLPAPLVSSFSVEALAAAREAAPEIPRALLCHRVPPEWRRLLDGLECAAFHVNQLFLGPRRIVEIKATGVPLLSFTVNDAKRARDLFEQGVDGVITDVPDIVTAPEA